MATTITGTSVTSEGIVTNTLGTSNFVAGVNAGNSIESGGNYNTVVGDEAGTAITTGERNTAIGYSALVRNTTGGYNTATGMYALQYNTTGATNSASGYYSLASNTTGGDNTASGYDSLGDNTTGFFNSGFGYEALARNTTASNNTAVGYRSLKLNTTGTENTSVGNDSLDANTTGSYNTATGRASLGSNTTGTFNAASGYVALLNVTTGARNCGFGAYAGSNLATGNNNTAIGEEALASGNGGATNNTVIGYAAGADGMLNITSDSNYLCVGNNATSNAVVKVSWTVGSDERDKTDIATLPSSAGLSFVNALRPVTYVWDNRDNYHAWGSEKYGERDHSKKSTEKQLGFIAQEVKAVETSMGWTDDHVVNTSNEESLKLQHDQLIPILTKAIQELSTQNAALEARLTALEA